MSRLREEAGLKMRARTGAAAGAGAVDGAGFDEAAASALATAVATSAIVDDPAEAEAFKDHCKNLVSQIDMIIYRQMADNFIAMRAPGARKPSDTKTINDIYSQVSGFFNQFTDESLIPESMRAEKLALLRQICQLNITPDPLNSPQIAGLIRNYIKEVALNRATREIDAIARLDLSEHARTEGELNSLAYRFIACTEAKNDDLEEIEVGKKITIPPTREQVAILEGHNRFFANRMLFAAIDCNNLDLTVYAVGNYDANLNAVRDEKPLLQIIAEKTIDQSKVPLLEYIISKFGAMTLEHRNILRANTALAPEQRTTLDPMSDLSRILHSPLEGIKPARPPRAIRGKSDAGGRASTVSSHGASARSAAGAGMGHGTAAVVAPPSIRGGTKFALLRHGIDAVNEEASRHGLVLPLPIESSGDDGDSEPDLSAARSRRAAQLSQSASSSARPSVPPLAPLVVSKRSDESLAVVEPGAPRTMGREPAFPELHDNTIERAQQLMPLRRNATTSPAIRAALAAEHGRGGGHVASLARRGRGRPAPGGRHVDYLVRGGDGAPGSESTAAGMYDTVYAIDPRMEERPTDRRGRMTREFSRRDIATARFTAAEEDRSRDAGSQALHK